MNFKNLKDGQVIKYIWLLPVVITAVMAFFSYANVDSIRDLIEAKRINSGSAWTLLGPQMAFSFYIGPWWFYLMSVFSETEYSWLLTSLSTALLNSLKYYVGYQLGRRLGGELMGLLMVMGLLLHSYSLMQAIGFTHTNVVETMLLLIIYLTQKDEHLSYVRAFTIGCIIGLAFHAHPTALTGGLFIFIKWLSGPKKLINAGMIFFGMLLVFLPLIINEYGTNYEQAIGASKYLESKTNSFDLYSYWKLLISVMFTSAYAMLLTFMSHYWALFFTTVQVIVMLFAFAFPVLAWKSLDAKIAKFVWQAWVYIILYTLGLVLIRANTPWYMTYGLSLMISLLVAIGLFQMFRDIRYKLIVNFSIFWLLFSYLWVQINLMVHLNNGEIVVPSSSLNDVKSLNFDLSGYAYEITAQQSRNHGVFTCQNSPIGLHGPYSYLIYSHSGVEHMSNCDDDLFYGNEEGVVNVIGVPPEYAKLISEDAFATVGNTSFYHPIDISEHQKSWKESFDHDYERRHKNKQNWKNETTSVSLNGGNNLIITKTLGFKMKLEVLDVQLGGKKVKPIHQRNHSALYICNQCDSKTTRWTVNYKESKEGMTNIVSF